MGCLPPIAKFFYFHFLRQLCGLFVTVVNVLESYSYHNITSFLKKELSHIKPKKIWFQLFRISQSYLLSAGPKNKDHKAIHIILLFHYMVIYSYYLFMTWGRHYHTKLSFTSCCFMCDYLLKFNALIFMEQKPLPCYFIGLVERFSLCLT